MDAQARKKAFYRAKLNAQKQDKRIDSPLVRYNEHDQPVCRVCDIALKSESLWPTHQASRKHNEAINNLKVNAAAINQAKSAKPETAKQLAQCNTQHYEEIHGSKSEPSAGMSLPRSSSTLPPDFFDKHEAKRQKNDAESKQSDAISARTQETESFIPKNNMDGMSAVNNTNVSSEVLAPKKNLQISKLTTEAEDKQVKGALPEGFFDNKDADLRARGITPVKPDVKDEYKEFEKLIQEDLQVVDKRMEEEEFDAAETIEEEESVEQRAYRERVETLRRKKIDLKAARSVRVKGTEVTSKEPAGTESSSDDDSEENFSVDWRAKHL